jgi:Kef-type K+ transport system membrane component KefB
MNVYYVTAIWLGLALVAAVVSIRVAVPAALVEIVAGALAGNIPGLREPFGAAFGFCALVLGWTLHAAEIGGIALSTTSVAVVYAVMVETGLNRHDLGKLILAACFVTDLGTALALGGLFASYGWLLIVFVVVCAVTVALLPRLLRLAIRHLGQRISEYTTLLMATGLTFGSISALFGLTHHLIDQDQYTELVTVVILSAFVPTLIAQQFFRPLAATRLSRDPD